MKTTWRMMAACAAALCIGGAGSAFAQARISTSGPGTRVFAGGPGGMGAMGFMGGNIDVGEMTKACDLSAGQQQKIQAIQDTRDKVVKDKQAAINTARDALRKAFSEGNQEAITKTISDNRDLATALSDAYQKAHTDTLAVLTAEQKATWQEYSILKIVKARYLDAGLTEAQWTQILVAYEALAKSPDVKSNDILSKLTDKIELLLTREQKTKRLLAGRYAQMNKICQLTDKQMAQIVDIEDARTKATADLRTRQAPKAEVLQKQMQDAIKSGDHDAIQKAQQDMAEIWQGYQEINKDYDTKVQAVLTAEQKVKWDEQLQKNPWSQFGGGPGGVTVTVPPAPPAK